MENHDVQPPVEKQPKRMSVTLTAGDMKLTVLAQRKSSDRGETVAITTDAKGKTARGMTTKFESFDLAVAAVHEQAREAQKKGWQRAVRSSICDKTVQLLKDHKSEQAELKLANRLHYADHGLGVRTDV